MHKVTIALKNSKSITVFLDTEQKNILLDQFYDICDHSLEDNVLEIIANDSTNETTLVKSDEVIYIQSVEILDECKN